MNKKVKFDCFGAEIFCRFCRKLNFDCDHHPNDCNTCYNCGEKGHLRSTCPKSGLSIKSVNRNEKRSKSMRKQILIDNTSQLSKDEPISIDVEKVQGKDGQMLPGWVCVYKRGKNRRRQKPDDIVYSAKIRQLRKDVDSYATPWSGLTRIDLSERSVPLNDVQVKLKEIFKERTLVGVAVKKDLIDLGLSADVYQTIDLQDVFRDEKDQPISLKVLSYAILGKKIQEFADNYDKDKAHDPVIDSRMTLKIYNRMQNCKPNNGSYQWCRDLVNQAIMTGQIRAQDRK